MNKSYLYSISFLLNAKNLPISNIFPEEILKLDIKFDTKPHLDFSNIIFRNNKIKNNKYIDKNTINKCKKSQNDWKNNMIKIPIDIKHITSILNKLTNENYNKLLEETKTFNYSNPEIISKIFKKILEEPFFSKIYAKFCNDLPEIHELLTDLYIKEFEENNHKNLVIFIGELYNIKLITDLTEIINILITDLTENNLEILCTLIKTVGVNKFIFKDVLNNLDNIKNKFKPRFKFMIMDIIDLKNK